jgi:hypothetical protein
LALTLNSAISSTVYGNDSEIFFGLGVAHDRTVEQNIADFLLQIFLPRIHWPEINFGYSSFIYNNFYYKLQCDVAKTYRLKIEGKGGNINSLKSENIGATIRVGVGYNIRGDTIDNTIFYYGPEIKFVFYQIFGNEKESGLGISISPCSLKFPLIESLSVLVNPASLDLGKTSLDRIFFNVNSSLMISYKL